jgi:protease I
MHMAKILFIVAQKGFRDEELLVPKEMLEKEGHTARIASMTRAKAVGSRGVTISPDMGMYEANPAFFDCVVIVGGPGSPALSQNKEVLDFVLAMEKAGRIVSAICLGPMTLARAGVLAGKDATVFPDRNAIHTIRECGARYLTEPIVVDGNIVTADSPESAGLFAQQLIAMLKTR